MSIKIKIGGLMDGESQFDFLVSPQELGIEEDIIKGKLVTSVILIKNSSQLTLSVETTGLFKLTCDRCLEIFEVPFKSEFELVFVQDPGLMNCSNDDYVKLYSPFDKSIDITNDVREYVLLSIPMRKIPPEIDGKCSWCGISTKYWNKYIVNKGYLKK